MESCKSLLISPDNVVNLAFSAKYPLAVVEVLLEVFGPGIGGGYDIRCKFGTTLNCSKLGPLA